MKHLETNIYTKQENKKPQDEIWKTTMVENSIANLL